MERTYIKVLNWYLIIDIITGIWHFFRKGLKLVFDFASEIGNVSFNYKNHRAT